MKSRLRAREPAYARRGHTQAHQNKGGMHIFPSIVTSIELLLKPNFL